MSQVDDMMVERAREDEVGTRNSFIQSLKVANGDSLERRLRKELEEQGILDPNDDDGESGQDEVQQELARCQQELRAVSQHNLAQLRRLAKAARDEMARQEVRNRLAEADREGFVNNNTRYLILCIRHPLPFPLQSLLHLSFTATPYLRLILDECCCTGFPLGATALVYHHS